VRRIDPTEALHETAACTNIRQSRPLRDGPARVLVLTGSSSAGLLLLVDEHLRVDFNASRIRGEETFVTSIGYPVAAVARGENQGDPKGARGTLIGVGGTPRRRYPRARSRSVAAIREAIWDCETRVILRSMA
jgi:hypothetical protein